MIRVGQNGANIAMFRRCLENMAAFSSLLDASSTRFGTRETAAAAGGTEVRVYIRMRHHTMHGHGHIPHLATFPV